MTVSNKIQNSFTAGELDPKLRGRSDIAAYFSGALKIRNGFVIPQGAVKRRPGLEYVAELSSGPIKLIPFTYSTDETYLIVVTPALFTIFKNGVEMDTVANSITAGQIDDLTWAQSYDTLILFHEAFSPIYLLRASDTSWSTGNWALNNVPSYNFGNVTTTPITIRDADGHVIEFTDWTTGDTQSGCLIEATGATFVAGDVGKSVKDGAGGICVITAVTDTDSAVGTIVSEFSVNLGVAGGIDLAAGDWTLEEASISSTRGYPACGTFFQGRLWMAGTSDLPNSIWASKVNSEHDFGIYNPDFADEGIFISAGGGIMSKFHRMYSGKHLFVFANTGEYYIPISNSEPVTPTNVSLVRNASFGSTEGLEAFEINGALAFMRAGGRSLIQATYNFANGGYENVDLSLLSSQVLNGPRSMGYRKQTSANEADYVLVVNSDGSLAVLCTLTTQNVTAWTHCTTEGSFREVGVDKADMYFVVDRVIDGTSRSFLERFNDDLLVDCGVINSGTALTYSGTALTYGNIPMTYHKGEYDSLSAAHLAGEEVQIIVDNAVEPAQDVPLGGKIEFVNPGEDAQIGLNFPVVDTDSGSQVFIQSMPIEAEDASGSTVGRKKRVSEVTVMVYETSHIEVRRNKAIIRRLGVDLLDSPVPKRSSDLTITGLLGWSDEITISCGQTIPLPMTLLGMAYRVRV